MTAVTRAVPRKRRRGPSFEAGLGRAITSDQPPAKDEKTATPGILRRLIAAAKPETDADATLQIGLGLLTVAFWGITGSLFAGLLAPGLVLTYVALMAYLRPRGVA